MTQIRGGSILGSGGGGDGGGGGVSVCVCVWGGGGGGRGDDGGMIWGGGGGGGRSLYWLYHVMKSYQFKYIHMDGLRQMYSYQQMWLFTLGLGLSITDTLISLSCSTLNWKITTCLLAIASNKFYHGQYIRPICMLIRGDVVFNFSIVYLNQLEYYQCKHQQGQSAFWLHVHRATP